MNHHKLVGPYVSPSCGCGSGGHTEALCLTSSGTTETVSTSVGWFSFSLKMYEGSNFSTFFQHFLSCSIFKKMIAILGDVKRHSTMVLICISLMIWFEM